MTDNPTGAVIVGPTLHTQRLTLRPPTLEDFPRWCELLADEEASRFIGGVQSKHQVWRTLCSVSGMWALHGEGMFSVLERQTGLWLGRIGPLHPYDWPGREIGWSLHPDAHGNGYALEAAVACMDYAFDVLEWPEVIHCIDPANTPSEKVAAKLGSYNQGPRPLPVPLDNLTVNVWGQTKAEWQINRIKLAGRT